MADSSSPPILTGLSDIAAHYDAAICDVWGVLHNGRDAFLPAADAMRRFRKERGPVVLLSNAPRLADGVGGLFDRVGLPRDFYDGIMTSGLAARDDLLRRTAHGRTLPLFYLGPPRDNPLFEGLNIRVTRPEDAEVVLCTGFYDDETETPDDYRAMLERFKARSLPFLCANPDIIVQRGDKLIYCAGAIARLYETLGGEVVYYGKPYPAVFEKALEKARAVATVHHPLVIGDGIDTDIAGANRMGLDALFVAGGIHASELREGTDSLGRLFAKSGVNAVGVMPVLHW
jgi:HAD superfamily hydrolase (TIGR01459 family)